MSTYKSPMLNTDTIAYLRLVGMRNLHTARDGRTRIEMSVMILNRQVSNIFSEKLMQLPSVISVSQNFCTGEQMKMLTQKQAKFQLTMRTIKVQEATKSTGSTILVGAKIRMYWSRMALLMIDITGLYTISSSHAHCCHISLHSHHEIYTGGPYKHDIIRLL